MRTECDYRKITRIRAIVKEHGDEVQTLHNGIAADYAAPECIMNHGGHEVHRIGRLRHLHWSDPT